MEIKIAGIVNDSITDGPGLRLTVFTQGCPHHCIGCHNPQTHDMNGGKWIGLDEILYKIDANPLLDGVTFSGGEPLLQVAALSALVEEIEKRKLNIMVYTGYTWEEIMVKKEKYIRLLEKVDYLVDGRFEESLKSYELEFKGSSNQRMINVKKSLANSCICVIDSFYQ